MHSSLRLPIAGRSWLSHPSPIDTNTGLTFFLLIFGALVRVICFTPLLYGCLADLVARSSFSEFNSISTAGGRLCQSNESSPVTHVVISIANEFQGSSESKTVKDDLMKASSKIQTRHIAFERETIPNLHYPLPTS